MKILLTGNTAFKLANFREGLIRRLIAEGHEITALVPFDDYVDKLTDLGCTVVDLEMTRKGTSLLSEIALLRRIHAQLKRTRPDIAFGYTIKNNIYGAFAARLLGIPFVPNVTGLGTAFEGRGLLNRIVLAMYRTAFRRVPVVFFQNTHDRALFLEAGIVRADQTALLPGSGVDLEAFDLRALPSADEAPLFMLIARMLKDKGIAEFVEAARIVVARYPQARFELLGPVDPDSRIAITKAELAAFEANSPVIYRGMARYVRPEIARADCIVLPSYYKEGTPRVLLEAAAMGRPIVTTDMPGCRDTVAHGETGFICAPRDAGDLAEKMLETVALGAEGRKRFGLAARALCDTLFNEQIVIDAYLSVIADLEG